MLPPLKSDIQAGCRIFRHELKQAEHTLFREREQPVPSHNEWLRLVRSAVAEVNWSEGVQ
jgi:hypothetical protein